jgi:glycosyltransferase involved in cell wall biosynthesis
MKGEKFRILHLCEHPVQYNTTLWQRQALHPKLDILVVYCNLRGAVPAMNPGFGVEVEWDVPLLEGYPWTLVPSAKGPKNGGRRTSLPWKNLWQLVTNGEFDAVCLGGYYFREAWTVLLAAKRKRIPVIVCTDAHSLESRRAKSKFTLGIKKQIVGRIFRMAAAVITSSSNAEIFLQSLGVPSERIFMGRSVVDNAWWTEHTAHLDRAALRRELNLPPEARIVLYCAKLQPWKRPGDLLEAFSRADVSGSYLLFAGDGPLRAMLEQRSRDLGVADRVHFLGFVNQTRLPGVYVASDVLVLPSDYEPFGLVINEAMLCGCPVVVSDRVGARYDLVYEDETGSVFPCGNVEALAKILRSLLNDPSRLDRMGAAAKERMLSWTPELNIATFLEAVEVAVSNKR